MEAAAQKRRRAILIVAILLCATGLVAVAATRARYDQSGTSDFDDFWLTGRHFIETGQIVETYGVHNYLPFFMLFMAPFCLLSIKVACVVFNLVALAGFAVSVRLIDGWWGSAGSSRPLRIVAPLLMSIAYVWGTVVMGQMALFTLTMLVVAWHAVETRRDALGGFWLALAISTKVYPVILVPWFILKRRWRLLAGMAVSLVAMNIVATGLVMGMRDSMSAYRDFWTRSAVEQSSLTLSLVASDKMSYTNQSAALLARRMTQPTDSGVDGADGRPVYVNLVEWDDRPIGFGPLRGARVQWLMLAVMLAVVLPGLWICRRRADVLSPERLRCEYAAFIVLALLISPVVWSFYYALCYLPLAMVCRHGLEGWRRGRRLSFTLAVSIIWWLGLIAIAVPRVRMCGYHWFACLALYICMLRLAHRSGVREATSSPSTSPSPHPRVPDGLRGP